MGNVGEGIRIVTGPFLHRRMFRLAALILVGGAALFLGFDGMTKNWADLEVGARDPKLEAVVWTDTTQEAAVERTAKLLQSLPRWKVVAADPTSGTLHATHLTWLWRFVDDVHLRFSSMPGGIRITGQSRSRVGKGDLGQNARNLRELAAVLRQAR